MRMARQTPATELAEVLGALTVADDQNGRDTKPLIRVRTWVNLLRDTVRGTDPDKLSVADIGLWPKMSLAANPRRLRKAYAAVSYINAFRRALRWRINQLIS